MHDMYGHEIIPLKETGYGVSTSFFDRGDGSWQPHFTFFHMSDGFRQSLFSIMGDRPEIVNVFRERLAEVHVSRLEPRAVPRAS